MPTRLAVIFVCVFLLGTTTGALVSMNITDHHFNDFLNRTNDPASLARRIDAKLDHDYHLDDAQKARIAPLTQEMAGNLYQLRRKFAQDVLSTLDQSHHKIGEQLNPSQRADYEKTNRERRQRSVRVLMPATNNPS